jgi:hypothetical protein
MANEVDLTGPVELRRCDYVPSEALKAGTLPLPIMVVLEWVHLR